MGTIIVERVEGVRAQDLPSRAVLTGSESIFLFSGGVLCKTTVAALANLAGGRASDDRDLGSTDTPTLAAWNVSDAAIYGNFPRVVLMVKDAIDGTESPVPGVSPIYTVDRTDPDNPIVTQIAWNLGYVAICRVLIN